MRSRSESLPGVRVEASAGFITAACIGLAGAILRTVPARGIFPEPFDVFNHVGNLNGSSVIGYAGGLYLGQFYAERAKTESKTSLMRRTRVAMAVGATVAGAALNAVSETKLGMSITHIGTTGDIVDYSYGVVTAAACGVLLPKVVATKTNDMTWASTIDEVQESHLQEYSQNLYSE
jgi:hypothetical protein